MLQRIRQLARRSTGLCLVLAFASFASQGVAGTLSWCLHDEDSHVTSAVGPCHATAGQADASPGAAPSGHGAGHEACDHGSAASSGHVAAASAAASGSGPAVHAAPFVVAWHSRLPVALFDAPPRTGDSRRHSGSAPHPETRPRLCGAVAGGSARLLI